MTSLVQLRDLIQEQLNDAAGATFTDALVTNWIYSAVKEYSQYFAVQGTVELVAKASSSEYLLDSDSYRVVKRVISVEYPVDQSPRKYLRLRDHLADDFYQDSEGYDVEYLGDAEDRVLIFFSKTDFIDDESIYLFCEMLFDETQAAQIEIPKSHEHLIIMRVKWTAIEYLSISEMLDPTNNSSLLMGQLQQNANSARKSYYQMLGMLLLDQGGESGVARWKMDGYDRIY